MRKLKVFSILVVIVLCFTCLTGCLKADKVTYEENISKFRNEISNYVNTSGIIDEAYNFRLLIDDDNVNLVNAICDESSSFNLLHNNKQYSVMLKYISRYFSFFVDVKPDPVKEIPQQLNTNLYYNIEDLVNSVKDFKAYYDRLLDNFERNMTNPNTPSNINSLKDLLNKYQNVIGALLNINKTSQKINDYYIIPATIDYMNIAKIDDGEVERLIRVFKLYVSDYLYQKYMVFDQDALVNFENDSLYVKLNEIDSIAATANLDARNEVSAIKETYKYLRRVEEGLYQKSLEMASCIEKLNHVVPQASDANYAYYEAFNDYAVELMDNLVLLKTMFA